MFQRKYLPAVIVAVVLGATQTMAALAQSLPDEVKQTNSTTVFPWMNCIPAHSADQKACLINYSDLVNVNPISIVSSEDGFSNPMPRVRRSGQETHQYVIRGGCAAGSSGGICEEESPVSLHTMETWACWSYPTGVLTGDSMIGSRILLGGGNAFKVDGSVVSPARAIQDLASSTSAANSVTALSQGRSCHRFTPAYEGAQTGAQLLGPCDIDTNF
jgi:hypothetical protein